MWWFSFSQPGCVNTTEMDIRKCRRLKNPQKVKKVCSFSWIKNSWCEWPFHFWYCSNNDLLFVNSTPLHPLKPFPSFILQIFVEWLMCAWHSSFCWNTVLTKPTAWHWWNKPTGSSARRAALGKYRMVQEPQEGAPTGAFQGLSKGSSGLRSEGYTAVGLGKRQGGKETEGTKSSKSHKRRWEWYFESLLVS